MVNGNGFAIHYFFFKTLNAIIHTCAFFKNFNSEQIIKENRQETEKMFT